MSMDKWLSTQNKKSEESDKTKQPSEQQIQEVKRKKIKEILNDKTIRNENAKDTSFNEENDDFIVAVKDFANWLTHRTYIKGDNEKIEVEVRNLYEKMKSNNFQVANKTINKSKSQLIEELKEIPPTFLEEKIRIALNKKLRGVSLTTSDQYYLKKLKGNIEEKLKEARYYQLLKLNLEI